MTYYITLYWKILFFILIVSFIISFLDLTLSTLLNKEKRSYKTYKIIIQKYGSIYKYREYESEIYTPLDIIIDYKHILNSIVWFLKLYRIVILIISLILAPFIHTVVFLYIWVKTFIYTIRVIKSFILKKDLTIVVTETTLKYSWWEFIKLCAYNLDVLVLNRIKLVCVKKSIKDVKNIDYSFIWNFFYIMLVGKSFNSIKIFFKVVCVILIGSVDDIIESKPKKILIIRIKIYYKIFRTKTIWYGHQFFLNSYFTIFASKSLEFKKGIFIK